MHQFSLLSSTRYKFKKNRKLNILNPTAIKWSKPVSPIFCEIEHGPLLHNRGTKIAKNAPIAIL